MTDISKRKQVHVFHTFGELTLDVGPGPTIMLPILNWCYIPVLCMLPLWRFSF